MYGFEEIVELRTRDCDLNGKWRFSAMLEEMQEVAGIHCANMGYPRSALVAQGVVWVLVRNEIRMARYPMVGEKIRVGTFHMPTRHRLFPRYYLMTDEEGQQVGAASSIWALMSLETRESVSPESVGMVLPDNSGTPVPFGLPAMVPAVEGEEQVLTRVPVYTEIDVNQHVNNTRYADWMCNLLGTDLMKEKEIARMILEYHAEVLPGDEVTFRFARRDDRCRLKGFCGEKKAFDVGCELRDALR